MLKSKNIIVGITGSIAAYKAAILVRLLVKEGANVKIIMTKTAKEFITPLTMATLSKNPILVDFFNPENGEWNSHVDLGLWADICLIAPATANTIAKMATGVADNLLLTTYLSVRCPVVVVPAMDMDMYRHPTMYRNLKTLKSFGNYIVEPATGELASGLEGKGRMEEPGNIVARISEILEKKKLNKSSLAGKHVLITAGPTYEAIDPVRYIGNHSSGKMGFALAEEAAERGAIVTLVSGPVNLKVNHPNINIIDVVSAEEMYLAAKNEFKNSDVSIMCAAVADFTPAKPEITKIKDKGKRTLQLVPTKDIAGELGKLKKPNQVLVGFALETNDEIKNANEKLKKKNLDFIVLNSLKDKNSGFKYDTNKITILGADNKSLKLELKPKKQVASDILNEVEKLLD